MKPKKFLNDPAKALDEFIAGLLLQYPNHLRKLSGGHHVLLHSSFSTSREDSAHPNKSNVSLLSGGGSGKSAFVLFCLVLYEDSVIWLLHLAFFSLHLTAFTPDALTYVATSLSS